MITLKSCKVCKKTFPEIEFPIAGTIKGKLYRRAKCSVCYQAVKRARRHRLAKWLEDYKKTQRCSKCPENDFRVLEFHHINDDKEFNVSEMTAGFSVENILKEINKCEVVCSNCHKRIHYNDRNGD